MGKALKMSLIILILLVLAVLAMPKSEKAFEVDDDMMINGGYSYAHPGSPYEEEMRTLTSNWSNFRIKAHSCMILNKFVFCIEERQHLPPTTVDGYTWFNCTWKVTIEDNTVYQQKSGGSKTKLTGDVANFTIGFAYILSNMEDFSSLDDGHIDYRYADPFTESSGNFWKDVKPYQREIWSYLSEANVSGSNYWFGTGLSSNKWHSELSSSQKQIVNEALEIANGKSDINIEEAEFYVLEDGSRAYQRLIVVKKSTSDSPGPGPGPGTGDDWDTSYKKPTTFTGKVWVEGQNGDKDIKVNEKANNRFDSGIDTPLSGVDVTLNVKVVQYEPVYGYRYKKYVWVKSGYYDADEIWHDTSSWQYNSIVYSDNKMRNTSSTQYRDETELIRDYEVSGTKTISKPATTNGVGEYTFPVVNLTTYEWKYNGKKHLVSEYIKTSGTVTFKYNGVSYIQVVPVESYTKNTSSAIYSNATESGRATFNDKFKTVDLSKSIAAGAYADFSGGKSVLNIPTNGVKSGDSAYQISANTNLGKIGTSSSAVSARTIRVNLGLLTREIDVSLSTRGR